MLSTAAVAWLPWRAESFARARAGGRPVLLSIAPAWCGHSAGMDTATFADPVVAALITAHFVAIRVDPDRRPDIAERYSLGGWPTTAFLTPEGDILGGGTFIERHRLADVLRRVSAAFAPGNSLRRAPGAPASAAAPGETPTPERLIDLVASAFDSVHGGFGGAPKFPHASPVRLALELYRDGGSPTHREMAVTTLDAMGWGPLYDETDGGFFRYARRADWGDPNGEKLLDVNASLLDLYIDAAETLELGRYLERAADILRYVQSWLADQVDGGWAGSQRADPSYADGHDSGAGRLPPPIDRTLFTDWNALMASSALKAGRALSEPSLSEFAIRSLERMALLCYRPGGGMAHYHDGEAQVRGLLDDQIVMAAAQLDAFEATGNIVYEMLAEELALHAVNLMWDSGSGGFFDRIADEAGDIGLLGEPRKPFAANCAAARLLDRLGRTANKPRYRELAEQTLSAIGPRAAGEGPLAADYVLAVRAVRQRP
jgi:uncharacterized protein YyaL (SSP411 family)